MLIEQKWFNSVRVGLLGFLVVFTLVSSIGIQYTAIQGNISDTSISEQSEHLVTSSFETDFDYKKSHEIHGASGAGYNYQIKITVHYGSGTDGSPKAEDVYLESNCQPDFDDIRFVDNDDTTPLDYWRYSYVLSDYSIFWVEIKDSLNSGQTALIYLYYGNSQVVTTSNGDATFLFFDDFEDESLGSNPDGTNWANPVGESGTSDYVNIVSDPTNGANQVLESKESGNGVSTYVQSEDISNIIGTQTSAVGYKWRRDRDQLLYSSFIGTGSAMVTWRIYPIGGSYKDFEYYTGSTYTNFVPAWVETGEDEWWSTEWRFGSTMEVEHDNVVYAGGYRSNIAGTLKSFQLPASHSYRSNSYWVDDVYVRKLATSEPTHGDWNDETIATPLPMPNPSAIDYLNIRSIAYQPAHSAAYQNHVFYPDNARSDIEYIKSLGFNTIKLWADGGGTFFKYPLDSEDNPTYGYLDQLLSITDNENIYVMIASIPETSVLGWYDPKFGPTPTADNLIAMAQVAGNHQSVIANSLHLNSLAEEDGVYFNHTDFENDYWWPMNPQTTGFTYDIFQTDFEWISTSYYQESLLSIKPKGELTSSYVDVEIDRISLDYDTITLRVHSMDSGAAWSLFVWGSGYSQALKSSCQDTGIFQYTIPSNAPDEINIRLYADFHAVRFDWLMLGQGFVNMANGNDYYRDFYKNLASDINAVDPNIPVFFFCDQDPDWDWVPIQEDYWGTDLQVEAFGLQPYTQKSTNPLFPHETFDQPTFERLFRYFGQSNRPLYVDEWGVKDSIVYSKTDQINNFLFFMEQCWFEGALEHGEKVIGWSYFILDDPAEDYRYGIRNKGSAIENVFKNILEYRPYAWSPMTIASDNYFTANKYSQNNNMYLWYDMSTAGSRAYGYTFMWFTHLNTIRVRDNNDPMPGTLGVTGWFMKSDTLYSNLRPGRNYVRVYVLNEAADTVLAYKDVLTYQDSDNSWIYKDITIYGLDPGANARIAIGRADSWSYDWNLYFAFHNIQIWDGS